MHLPNKKNLSILLTCSTALGLVLCKASKPLGCIAVAASILGLLWNLCFRKKEEVESINTTEYRILTDKHGRVLDSDSAAHTNPKDLFEEVDLLGDAQSAESIIVAPVPQSLYQQMLNLLPSNNRGQEQHIKRD